MTHESDGYAVGGVITNTIIGSQGGFGIQTTQGLVLDIVPLTKNNANIAASQSPGSAALTLTAGTGITSLVDALGVTRYQVDVPRCITITSGGNDSGIQFLVKGYDRYGAPMSQLITGGNGATVTTKKAFYQVTSVAPVGGSAASTVSVGTADVFGLPIQIIDSGYISALIWASPALPAFDTGTLTLADQTNPATNLTGDVRGTYAPSSASNGTRRLVADLTINATQASVANTAAGLIAILGVTQA